MPSKKVFIKRNRPFIHDQMKSVEAREHMAEAKQGIGSYFATPDSQRQGSGLVDEEVQLLLPQILDIQPEDREFRKAVARYYTEINTLIPFERGKEFEIGLLLDNDRPVTYYEERQIKNDKNDPEKVTGTTRVYNMPINNEDYIRYRHGIKHPWTAKSPEEAKGNQTVHFYVEDPERVMETQINELEYADKALTEYQMIKTDKDKIKQILSLLRAEIPKKHIGQVIIVDKMTDDERLLALRTLATTKPYKFYTTATDKMLKNKYLLNELISVNLLKRAGSSILVSDSGEPLGSSDSEAAKNLFEDPTKSPLVSTLKAAYKDLKSKQTFKV